MTYNYYLKQQLPICEVRLDQKLAKNPRLTYRLNRFSRNPYTRKYTNQEILFDNARNWENLSKKWTSKQIYLKIMWTLSTPQRDKIHILK